MFTITADAAKVLSNYSRTYDALMIEAENAIMAGTRTASFMSTEIDFTGVDKATAARVFDTLKSNGFLVSVRKLDIDGLEVKLMISWF